MQINAACQHHGSRAELGYFEIACPKLLGGYLKIGLLFICLPVEALFLQNCQFPVYSESFLSLQTFFSSVLGIKMSWRAININYSLHVEVNNLVVFLSSWVILIF